MRTLTFGLVAVLTVALLLFGGCPPEAPGPQLTVVGDDNENTPKVDAYMPAGVSLDISELPEDEDNETYQEAAPTRNVYARVVRSCATVMHRFHRVADRALALGAEIRRDFTSATQTQVSGSYRVWGYDVNYKADFAAFDFDGDGIPDGSGNAVDLPVALRIWADRGEGYQPFLCALITQRPTSERLGAGKFYVNPAAGDPRATAGVQGFVEYDRTADDHRWHTACISGPVHPLCGLSAGVARVDVREDEAGGLAKTVRAAYQFDESLYNFNTFQAACHYVVGGVGLLATGQATGGAAEVGFTNVCVNLETQALATDGECDAFDTQDMTLLDAPAAGATDFPDDFPAAPTF
jgi:hypothetical protein